MAMAMAMAIQINGFEEISTVGSGKEKYNPNLHHDYDTSKQRKEQDDFIRGDLSGLSGFRGIFEKIGIVWGCDLLTENLRISGLQLVVFWIIKVLSFFPFNRRFVWIQQRFPRSNRKLGYGHHFSLGSSYDGRSWSIVFLFLFFLISSQSTLFCIVSVVLWCSSISVLAARSEYKIFWFGGRLQGKDVSLCLVLLL